MEWINTAEDFRLQELCKKAAALIQNKTMAEIRVAATGTEKGDRIQETGEGSVPQGQLSGNVHPGVWIVVS